MLAQTDNAVTMTLVAALVALSGVIGWGVRHLAGRLSINLDELREEIEAIRTDTAAGLKALKLQLNHESQRSTEQTESLRSEIKGQPDPPT